MVILTIEANYLLRKTLTLTWSVKKWRSVLKHPKLAPEAIQVTHRLISSYAPVGPGWRELGDHGEHAHQTGHLKQFPHYIQWWSWSPSPSSTDMHHLFLHLKMSPYLIQKTQIKRQKTRWKIRWVSKGNFGQWNLFCKPICSVFFRHPREMGWQLKLRRLATSKEHFQPLFFRDYSNLGECNQCFPNGTSPKWKRKILVSRNYDLGIVEESPLNDNSCPPCSSIFWDKIWESRWIYINCLQWFSVKFYDPFTP